MFLVVATAFASQTMRRSAPVLALISAVVTVNVYLLLQYPFGPVLLCLVISMFEVARQRSLRMSGLACGLAAAVTALVMLLRTGHDVPLPGMLALAWSAWLILPWSLGALVHVASAARERSRRELVARVALQERMRIAGEVHDVAGHGFALIAMQAGISLLVFEEKPDQARKSLEAVQTISTRSLAELRAMLNIIHPEPTAAPGPVLQPEAPPVPVPVSHPGLAGLIELVETVRQSGLGVTLALTSVDTLEPALDAVVYRVVQESLTNVLRHAGATRVEVEIEQHEGKVLVRVLDEGSGSAIGVVAFGRGLSGIRNRVVAAGGRLEAGPRAGGGFEVQASLPLSREGGARWSA